VSGGTHGPRQLVQCVDARHAAALAGAARFSLAWADGVASTDGADAGKPPALLARQPEPDPLACLAGSTPRSVLAWMPAQQVQALVQHGPPPPGLQQLLLSAQLAPPGEIDLPPPWQPHVAWMSMHSDPVRLRAARALVLAQWLRGLGLPQRPGTTQAEVHAATFFFGDALARMRQGWSQAWLMEQLETAVNNRPAGAAYFSLSLAAGQRIAAKTGAVLVVGPTRGPAEGDELPWSERLQPAGELMRAEE
jgi:hypothetical protein